MINNNCYKETLARPSLKHPVPPAGCRLHFSSATEGPISDNRNCVTSYYYAHLSRGFLRRKVGLRLKTPAHNEAYWMPRRWR